VAAAPPPTATASAAPRPPIPVYSPPAASATQVYAPAPPPPAPANTATTFTTTAPVQTATDSDWEVIIADLQQITEDQLGNRARKVKDLLGAAERSRVGVQSAIDQIPTISILFVDASRLEALANDLRARLEAYS
jgi:hypothetical protein